MQWVEKKIVNPIPFKGFQRHLKSIYYAEVFKETNAWLFASWVVFLKWLICISLVTLMCCQRFKMPLILFRNWVYP